jgi:hypothetical protein
MKQIYRIRRLIYTIETSYSKEAGDLGIINLNGMIYPQVIIIGEANRNISIYFDNFTN